MKRKIVALFVITVMVLTVTTVAVTAKPANVTSPRAGAAPTQLGVGQATGGSGAAAICWDNNGNFFLFTKGADGALWYQVYNPQLYQTPGNWSPWQSLSGKLTSDPAVVCQASYNVPSGPITVFVRGTDGAVWSISTTNAGASWGGWTSIGGKIASGTGPMACSWNLGRLDVFVQGTDNALWHKGWTGTSWSGWQSLGGKLTSSPAACSWDVNRIDVFARGTNGALWHKGWSGTAWSGWQSLGGVIMANTAPAACSFGLGFLDVFVVGTNGAMYHKWYVAPSNSGTGWSGWENVGGYLTSSPAAAVRWPPGAVIDIYARGGNGFFWENSYYDPGWSGWIS